MNPSLIEIAGTVIFVLAVCHTFLASKLLDMAHHYPEDSMMRPVFHFLGEVEAVFGLWSLVFFIFYALAEGINPAIHYLEARNFTEPAFVFVIMCMAATRPVIVASEKLIAGIARLLPFSQKMSFYIATLAFGPLLGSFITEPAAMTVVALVLYETFYKHGMSERFKYATLGVLFVNISVGGTLSHFAAPPVLMVASKWNWDMFHMIRYFGYKGAAACLISTLFCAFIFKNELQGNLPENKKNEKIPLWIIVWHLVSMALVVYGVHHMVFFLAVFLFFLSFMKVTEKYQERPKIRESLMVGFFLAGLVVLGTVQEWWLKDIITKMDDLVLYFGATALTAVTDNAALTYLGSLVELSDSAKYYLVAGAVSGGGLTVIANAPNPAGYGILKGQFKEGNIHPLGLFVGALFPTLIVILCFLFLP